MRPRSARGLALLLVAGTAWLAVGPVQSAHADPSLTQLQAQASALRQRLDQLSVQQGLAVERYDAAAGALQTATTAQILAGTALQDTQRSAARLDAAGVRRARALYMSGGPLGLAATVLESSDLSDVLTRWQTVTALVQDDARIGRQASRDVSAARAFAATLARARALTAARQVAANQAVAAVQSALSAQAQLLAATDARVVALADQQRQAAEAAALARAQTSAAQLGIPSWPGVRGGPSSGWPTVAAPNQAAATAIAAARTRLGLPYVWGATGPDSFDCSGLTGWAYRQAGIAIPRTASEQFLALPRVPLSQLEPGDLVFYATNVLDPTTIHHVAIYLGAGLSLYAPQTGSVVKIGPVAYGQIIGAVRPSMT